MTSPTKIPKIINYCWFGGQEKPESVINCIESWKKFCPEYKLVEWNEANYDISKKNIYVQQAANRQKWAFVTDYARLDILFNNGGLYFDTDVELIRSPETLLENTTFFGLENVLAVNTGIGCGSIKGAPVLKKLMVIYDNSYFVNKEGKANYRTCVEIATNELINYGLKPINETQRIEVEDRDVMIYSTDFFCPQLYHSKKINLTKNTYSIHHYNASWQSKTQRILSPIKTSIRKLIDKFFGIGSYEKLKSFIRN